MIVWAQQVDSERYVNVDVARREDRMEEAGGEFTKKSVSRATTSGHSLDVTVKDYVRWGGGPPPHPNPQKISPSRDRPPRALVSYY